MVDVASARDRHGFESVRGDAGLQPRTPQITVSRDPFAPLSARCLADFPGLPEVLDSNRRVVTFGEEAREGCRALENRITFGGGYFETTFLDVITY